MQGHHGNATGENLEGKGQAEVTEMRGMMVVVGNSGVGGALGCLAGTPMPGFELVAAFLGAFGAAAGAAAGVLLWITQPPKSEGHRNEAKTAHRPVEKLRASGMMRLRRTNSRRSRAVGIRDANGAPARCPGRVGGPSCFLAARRSR